MFFFLSTVSEEASKTLWKLYSWKTSDPEKLIKFLYLTQCLSSLYESEKVGLAESENPFLKWHESFLSENTKGGVWELVYLSQRRIQNPFEHRKCSFLRK